MMRTTARRWTACVLVGVLSLLLGSAARAERPALQGALWLGMGSVGGAVDPLGGREVLNSLLLGVSLSVRLQHLVLGGSADAAGELFGHDESFLALHGGWTAPLAGGRLSVLGEGGRHSYDELGGGLLSGGEGTKATLPFVGLRVVRDVASRSRGQGALFGFWLTVREDIGTATARDEGGFFGTPDGIWQVGGTSITGGVRLGFDLGAGGPRKPRTPAG